MRHSRRQTLKTILAVAAAPVAAIPAEPSKPIRLVVLDVGGTIIEDRGDVPESLRAAFAKYNLTITPAEIAEWRGAGKREVVRHFVELRAKTDQAKLTAAIYEDFSSRVIEAYKTAKPIPGVEDAFKKLRQSGFLIATNTGFDRPITDSIFKRLQWQQYFAATITSDDVADGRPAPFLIFHAMEATKVNSVAEVIAVGDTPLDLQAAANAGVRGAIGVLSGAGTADKLKQEHHTHIVPSVADLPELLRAKF